MRENSSGLWVVDRVMAPLSSSVLDAIEWLPIGGPGRNLSDSTSVQTLGFDLIFQNWEISHKNLDSRLALKCLFKKC